MVIKQIADLQLLLMIDKVNPKERMILGRLNSTKLLKTPNMIKDFNNHIMMIRNQPVDSMVTVLFKKIE